MTAKKGKALKTPIRMALRTDSSLRASVVDGIGALKNADRRYLASEVRATFADSLDIDTALQEGNPQAHRWDYLLGHLPSRTVIGIEPHSAKEDQVSRIIQKQKAARTQLAKHLRPGERVVEWLWVASGTVQFADTEKTRLRLDQSGIRFVGRQVLAKHLPVRPHGKGS